MDYEYSNEVLDRKLETLRQCNYEIEKMIESIDNDSSSNQCSFYSGSSEKSEEIHIKPGFFENYHCDCVSHDDHDDYDEKIHIRRVPVFLRPQSSINKARISFGMNRSSIASRTPKPVIPRYPSQNRVANTLQKDFQNKIQNETKNFVNRCVSAPLRHSYGSTNDIRSLPKPPKSASGPRYSRPKTIFREMTTNKEKSFTNLNKWVPNGNIKHSLAASLNNLTDLKKSIVNEKPDPKKESLKQREQSWKPNGKIKEKSVPRESQISVKESTEELNEKSTKYKSYENKIKEMEKGWKPNGKAKETQYPKTKEQPALEKEKSTTNLSNKADPKIKEKVWKPNGKIEQPYVPFKSVEVKPQAETSKVDEKKEAELKKIKELESKWKPSGKTASVKTADSLKANTTPLVTEKTPSNPLTKSFPQSKIKSKPPIGEKLTKKSTTNFINKNKEAFKNIDNSNPLNSTPTKNPKPLKKLINEGKAPKEQSIIKDSGFKVDTDELDEKADLEFENDIKNEKLNNSLKFSTSTPKVEKNVSSPKSTDLTTQNSDGNQNKSKEISDRGSNGSKVNEPKNVINNESDVLDESNPEDIGNNSAFDFKNSNPLPSEQKIEIKNDSVDDKKTLEKKDDDDDDEDESDDDEHGINIFKSAIDPNKANDFFAKLKNEMPKPSENNGATNNNKSNTEIDSNIDDEDEDSGAEEDKPQLFKRVEEDDD
jgi:hypothetical protein